MKKLLLVFVAIATLAATGCKKETPVYNFTVRVVDEEGTRLPNVFVEATADVPDAIPDFSGITSETGEISFSYEYEAVLKIRASRGNPARWMGCNFVKLSADNTVIVTVVLAPFDPTQPGC